MELGEVSRDQGPPRKPAAVGALRPASRRTTREREEGTGEEVLLHFGLKALEAQSSPYLKKMRRLNC